MNFPIVQNSENSLCEKIKQEWHAIETWIDFRQDDEWSDSIRKLLDRQAKAHNLPDDELTEFFTVFLSDLQKQYKIMSEPLEARVEKEWQLTQVLLDKEGRKGYIHKYDADTLRLIKNLEELQYFSRFKKKVALEAVMIDLIENRIELQKRIDTGSGYSQRVRPQPSEQAFPAFRKARQGITKLISYTGVLNAERVMEMVLLINDTDRDLIFIVSSDPRVRQIDSGEFNVSTSGFGIKAAGSSKTELHDVLPVGANDRIEKVCSTKLVFITVCELQIDYTYVVYRCRKPLKIGSMYKVTTDRLIGVSKENVDYLKRFDKNCN